MLYVAYYNFYAPLGLTPTDVGVNYTTLIAESIGLVPNIVLWPLYVGAGYLLSVFIVNTVEGVNDPPLVRWSRVRATAFPGTLLFMLVWTFVSLIVSFGSNIYNARLDASILMSGQSPAQRKLRPRHVGI